VVLQICLYRGPSPDLPLPRVPSLRPRSPITVSVDTDTPLVFPHVFLPLLPAFQSSKEPHDTPSVSLCAGGVTVSCAMKLVCEDSRLPSQSREVIPILFPLGSGARAQGHPEQKLHFERPERCAQYQPSECRISLGGTSSLQLLAVSRRTDVHSSTRARRSSSRSMDLPFRTSLGSPSRKRCRLMGRTRRSE
jgi:hypothetical protein